VEPKATMDAAVDPHCLLWGSTSGNLRRVELTATMDAYAAARRKRREREGEREGERRGEEAEQH